MAQKWFWLLSLNTVNFVRTCYLMCFHLHNLLTFFIQRHFLQQFHMLNISSQSNSAFKNDVKKKLTFSVFPFSSATCSFFPLNSHDVLSWQQLRNPLIAVSGTHSLALSLVFPCPHLDFFSPLNSYSDFSLILIYTLVFPFLVVWLLFNIGSLKTLYAAM